MNLQLDNKAIGEKLAKYRQLSGLTQLEVMEQLGYDGPQMLSNIERGMCSASPKLLRNLVKIYKLNSKERESFSKLLKQEFSSKLKKAIGI